jgi:hypothetical protein
MANLIAKTTGNWLTAGTWDVAEAGASSVQTTRSASTNTTTSYVYSSAFTVTNADVIDGLLLHVKRVNTTGTVSVSLSEDNGSTATREVTVNASDLPVDQAWVLFKFGSTLTGDGGADYKVGIKGSSAGNATFYRDGTAGNWARLLRTTATSAPSAGDNLYIAGEWTAAATVSAITVTMNETATTDHGTLDIGKSGTLTYDATAATNYYLRLSGDLNIWDGGTLNIGTVATPIPSDSTAKLNLDCGSNVQYGLLVNAGGTFVAQGASKTVSSFLAANAAAAATTLTTSTSTGWKSGDEIGFAPTSRTYTEYEKRSLSGDASGTSITVASGLTNAHSGTSPTRAELINLTRNVSIFGASASLQSYVTIATLTTVDADYAEFYWMGSATSLKRGIDIATTTTNVAFSYCCFHDFSVASSRGVNIASSATNVAFTSCVSYGMHSEHYVMAGGSTTVTFDACIAIGVANTLVHGFDLQDRAPVTNCTAAGISLNGFNFAGGLAWATFSGNTAHSNGRHGVRIAAALLTSTYTIATFTGWRNAGSGSGGGIYLDAELPEVVISSPTLFGNDSANINVANHVQKLTITGATMSGDSSFATAGGLNLQTTKIFPEVILEDCDLGTASGIKVAHSSADIIFGTSTWAAITCRNTKLSSTTAISNLTGTALARSSVKAQKYAQTAGDHRAFYPQGIVKSDTAIYKTASPSERMTPSSASVKLQSGPKRKTVASGATATFEYYVRKSVIGDGAAYNGNQPRLILRKNVAAGISGDVVLDTATAASDGAWELLTGTSASVTDDAVLEAYVDADGTTGWLNLDI